MILKTAVIFQKHNKDVVNDRWLYFKCGAFLLRLSQAPSPESRAPSSEPRAASPDELSRDVRTDAGYLCDKATVLGAVLKKSK